MIIKSDKPEKGAPWDITSHDGTPYPVAVPKWRAYPDPRGGAWSVYGGPLVNYGNPGRPDPPWPVERVDVDHG